MASFMIGVLLLAGASDSSGLSFQAQVGYEPAVLIRGDDYRRGVIGGAFPNFEGFCYHSHSLTGKVGIQTRTGWETKVTLGLTSSIINHGSSNLSLPPDSIGELWLSGHTEWSSIEYNLGLEIGHSFGQPQRQWSLFLGLMFTWGKFSGVDSLFKWNHETNEEDIRVINVTSPVKGPQWYIGAAVPLFPVGRFSFQINPILKGGFIKEQSTNIPPEAEWKGPYTLPKCGLALGLTLNYSGGKQQ